MTAGVFTAPHKKSCCSSYHDVGGGKESHFYRNAGLTVRTLAIVRSRMTKITGPVLFAEKIRTFVSISICGVLVRSQISGPLRFQLRGLGWSPEPALLISGPGDSGPRERQARARSPLRWLKKTSHGISVTDHAYNFSGPFVTIV